MLESAKIIGASVLTAVTYGVLHDQVTVRISPEYFTIGHPPIFPADSPTLLALCWGVFATWWAGGLVGVMFAIVGRCGSRPKQKLSDFYSVLLCLFLATFIAAAIAFCIALPWANSQLNGLAGPLAHAVPYERHRDFLVARAIHGTSYAMGFAASFVLAIGVWRRRKGGRGDGKTIV